MTKGLFYLWISCASWLQAQELILESTLASTIQESSGLLYLNNRLITHNDSGGAASLYEINTTGGVSRTVNIDNASAIDWEAMAADDHHIYIGDFGNNSGSRRDLKIYRIAIADYLSAHDSAIMAQVIAFDYEDQTDFSPQLWRTNYDAEAMIVDQNNLYIFTKNWGDQKTNVYRLPKTPGDYRATKIDTLEVGGLITGASIDPTMGKIVLIGYNLGSAFAVTLSAFQPPLFSSGNYARYALQLPLGKSYQIEGIAFFSENQYYITAEEGMGGSSGLYTLRTQQILGTEAHLDQNPVLFPNPATDQLHIQYQGPIICSIYDLWGRLWTTSTQKKIALSHLAPGGYFVQIKSQKSARFHTQKLVVH